MSLLTAGGFFRMIRIIIEVNDGKVQDHITIKKTTLMENAIALRRLEEFKNKLLDLEYKDEINVREDLE